MRLPSAASHARHAPDDVEDQEAGDGDARPHPYYKPTWAVMTQPPREAVAATRCRWGPRYREMERTAIQGDGKNHDT